MEQKEAQQVTIREICSSCGRPVSKRKGPVTSWLFGPFVCECTGASSTSTGSSNTASPCATTQSHPDIAESKFEFLEKIGQSKYASVWKVRDSSTGQLFACKCLNDDVSKNPRTVKRFLQEAEMTEGLNHQNVISVFSKGTTTSGAPYLIMDYTANDTLLKVIDSNGPLDAAQAIESFIQICDALTYAHERGVIHRSLRPQNVIVSASSKDSEPSFIKVTDFGIARALPHPARETIFATGALWELLDPNYSSPELCLGKRIDYRADLFSLGCLMYYVLSGYTVFKGSPTEVILKTLRETPRLLTRRFPKLKVPEGLDLVIMRALEKDPSARYQSAAAVKEDLLLIRAGKQPVNCRKPIRKGTPTLRLDTINRVTGKIKPVKKSLVSFEPLPQAVTVPLMVLLILFSLSFGVLRDGLDELTEPVRNTGTPESDSATTSELSTSTIHESNAAAGRLATPAETVIRSKTGDTIIFQSPAGTIREAVEEAVRQRVSLKNADLQNADLKHANLEGADLSYANLANTTLSNASLENANLTGANLSNCTADGINLSFASLQHVQIEKGNMSRANLKGADMDECKISDTDFSQSTLHAATSRSGSFEDCNFNQADLSLIRFEFSSLKRCRISHANLLQATFISCDLSDSKIEHTELAKTQFGESLLHNVSIKGSDIDNASIGKPRK